MHIGSLRALSALGLLTAACFANGADTCSEDGRYYLRLAQRDLDNNNPALAVERLDLAVTAGCATAKTLHTRGRALQISDKLDEALDAYRRAQEAATQADTQANSIARYAEVLAQMGRRQEALDLLRYARALHSSPPEWTMTLALELESSLEAQQFSRERVLRAFSSELGMMTPASITPAPRDGAAADGAEEGPETPAPSRRPSMSFRIHFAFDSSEIEPLEEQNVRELAEGLADSAMSENRFLLIGHTDAQGGAQYNQQLSERRAEAVRRMVVRLKPELAGRVRSTGKGESELLYDTTDRDVHKWNRRVQVILDDG